MQLTDLDYAYPPELTAVEPSRPSRVAYSEPRQAPVELTVTGLLDRFATNDLLVVNESKVIPARVFTADDREILFLQSSAPLVWDVLFPARELELGAELRLPGDVTARLTRKGLPQQLTLAQPLAHEYFFTYGEPALPPYIQEARGERHTRTQDRDWYQTAWARQPGSVAAPTASLHFSAEDLARVANVARLTLHVGAGTFLPIRTQDLNQHQMHSECVEVPNATVEALSRTRERGGRVWALGTTVTRALESLDQLTVTPQGRVGSTALFIRPPYEFKNVDVLLTNFHQPRSTLLALVSTFAGRERVREVYAWAIERRFKLFSYGDLSAWTRA